MISWVTLQQLVDRLQQTGALSLEELLDTVGNRSHVEELLGGRDYTVPVDETKFPPAVAVIAKTGGALLEAKKNPVWVQGGPAVIYALNERALAHLDWIRSQSLSAQAAKDQHEVAKLRAREQFLLRILHRPTGAGSTAVDDKDLAQLLGAVVNEDRVVVGNDVLDGLYNRYV